MSSFSPLRAFFWPLHRFEMKRFLPLLGIAFFIGFNYNILRAIKDTLLVTAEFSGAEVLPFIKVWGMVPAALFITLIYNRLNNRLARDRVFYAMIGLFLAFFAVFTFILYPLRDYLHPHESANFLQSMLPQGFKGLIAIFRYWTYSSFYIMSDLWSSAILSMLFWGFANEITPISDAKRFYSLIAIGLNIAAIASGTVSYWFSHGKFAPEMATEEEAWGHSLLLLTWAVLLSGLIILSLYRYLSKQLSHSELVEKKEKAPRVHMTIRENFAFLMRSKYLLSLAGVVLAYNLIINLVEVIWKDQVKQLFPNPTDFNSYMSQVTTATGIISLFASLFISGQMIRKFGWTRTALMTPLVLLVSSIAFFFFFFGRNSYLAAITLLGTSPLAIIVFLGSLQNVFCRSAKFTVFDATKEMAFIPLPAEARLKGKTVIDGVGSRIGKSGGSLIHQVLLLLFSTISASAPIVAGIIFAVIILWLFSVKTLGKGFNALTAQEAETDLPSETTAAETLTAASK